MTDFGKIARLISADNQSLSDFSRRFDSWERGALLKLIAEKLPGNLKIAAAHFHLYEKKLRKTLSLANRQIALASAPIVNVRNGFEAVLRQWMQAGKIDARDDAEFMSVLNPLSEHIAAAQSALNRLKLEERAVGAKWARESLLLLADDANRGLKNWDKNNGKVTVSSANFLKDFLNRDRILSSSPNIISTLRSELQEIVPYTVKDLGKLHKHFRDIREKWQKSKKITARDAALLQAMQKRLITRLLELHKFFSRIR